MIRRYIGADVIIMYGGLKEVLEEDSPNLDDVDKSLQHAIDSLDEVIAIFHSRYYSFTVMIADNVTIIISCIITIPYLMNLFTAGHEYK